jgi:hypothetical protein
MVLYDIPEGVERRFTVRVSYGLSMQWRMLLSSSQNVGRGRECFSNVKECGGEGYEGIERRE